MGLNGWYVSNVMIVINIDEVNHTYYSFDNNTWTEYTAPITVSTDGYYTLYVFFVYPNGTISKIYGPYPFKIDKTPPTLNVTVNTNFWKTIWWFTINVSDAMSGVGMVEIYFDGVLVGNITPPGPYNFMWAGGGKTTAQVIAYDNAGNSASSSIMTLCIQSQSQTSFSVQQKTMLFQHLTTYDILAHRGQY